VFGVIAYHANFIYLDTNLVSGGFIGVDIFFVISGYLIARILLSDIAENQFSYIWFYEKRARRLLPLLLCVITVCIPFAWAIYLPSQMVDFSTQILKVLTFSSNVYYWFDGSYWTAEAISALFTYMVFGN